MSDFENCWKKIKSYCYICGKYVLPQYRVALTEKIEHIYCFYFGKVLVHRRWLPNICCKICYNALDAWYNGKRESMPFGVPMNWLRPALTHNASNCYVCANDVHTLNSTALKKHVYWGVTSAELPKPHSDEIPIPKRPSPVEATINDPTTVAGSVFVPDVVDEEAHTPVLMSQQHLHSLARRLGLSKAKVWQQI